MEETECFNDQCSLIASREVSDRNLGMIPYDLITIAGCNQPVPLCTFDCGVSDRILGVIRMIS